MWYNYAKLVFGSLSGWSFARDIDILICIANRAHIFSEYVIERGCMVICIEPTFFLRVYNIRPLHGINFRIGDGRLFIRDILDQYT